jgi:hypothetical protein
MLALFAEAFEDEDSGASQPPGDEEMRRLLASDTFLALTAAVDGVVVGPWPPLCSTSSSRFSLLRQKSVTQFTQSFSRFNIAFTFPH